VPVSLEPSKAPLASDAKPSPSEIEKNFSEANPGLQPSMISVSCRKAVLREVRICFTKDLKEFSHVRKWIARVVGQIRFRLFCRNEG